MPKDRSSNAPERKAVSLRVRDDALALIEKAASIRGQSRADFMIEASCRAAEDVVLDQRVIMVDRGSYDHFLAVLERPPKTDEKLRKLLGQAAPWEK